MGTPIHLQIYCISAERYCNLVVSSVDIRWYIEIPRSFRYLLNSCRIWSFLVLSEPHVCALCMFVCVCVCLSVCVRLLSFVCKRAGDE